MLLLCVVVCGFGVYGWLLLVVALLFYVLFADCWSLFVVCRCSMVFVGCCLLCIYDGRCLLVVGCVVWCLLIDGRGVVLLFVIVVSC